MSTQIQTTAGEVLRASEKTLQAIAPMRSKYLADLGRYDNAWFVRRWFMEQPWAWSYYNVDARVVSERLAKRMRAIDSETVVFLDADDAALIGFGGDSA